MANEKRISFLQDPTVFSDLRDLEAAERRRLEDRRRLLKEISMPQRDGSPRKRFLTPEEASELEEIEKKLATDDVVDPLFKAVQKGLSLPVKDHKGGLFPSQQGVETLHNMFSNNGEDIDWPSFAALARLEDEDELIEELRGLWDDTEARDLLPQVAEAFDSVVARLRGKLSNRERRALSEKILEISGQTFFEQLAQTVERGKVLEAENLIDWLIAASPTATPNFEIQAFVQENSHDLTAQEKNLAAVVGILQADREEPPPYRLSSIHAFDPAEQRRNQEFGRALFAAQGEYTTNRALFDAVLPVLISTGGLGPVDEVSAVEWARAVRHLVKRGIPASEAQLGRRVNEALNSIQNVGDDIPPSDISIDLPDLESEGATDHEILEHNVLALQPAYFAAMFEELKVFQVMDKLVELFQNGILPIGKGEAGNNLFKYWKESATRVSEAERRSFYARTLGFVGGDDGGYPNREFNDLFMRFVSAVSNFIRQNSVDDLLRTKIPGAISQQQVRKAGRDLAANLSLHGYGMAHFMATELQKQIKDVMKVLSDPDIKNAYGARDMWQVIDQVAALELGGSRNSVRYRTMAAASAIIFAWLSQNARKLSSTSFGPILDLDEIRNPPPRRPGTKASTHPTDFDLVNACEQWLAVTGTQEATVYDYSQPKEAPNMTSKPIQIPEIARENFDMARETLEAVGVPAMSYGGNGSRRY